MHAEKYIYSNSSAISANVSKSNKSDTVDVTVHIETDVSYDIKRHVS